MLPKIISNKDKSKAYLNVNLKKSYLKTKEDPTISAFLKKEQSELIMEDIKKNPYPSERTVVDEEKFKITSKADENNNIYEKESNENFEDIGLALPNESQIGFRQAFIVLSELAKRDIFVSFKYLMFFL